MEVTKTRGAISGGACRGATMLKAKLPTKNLHPVVPASALKTSVEMALTWKRMKQN
jgi:hypothetical protein